MDIIGLIGDILEGLFVSTPIIPLKGSTDTRKSQMCYSNRKIDMNFDSRTLKGATDRRRIQTIYSEGA